MKRPGNREKGQTLVLAVLMMVVIIGIVALAIDGGFAYAQRRRMQNAADAAAMAGVWTLATSGSGAVGASVTQYATANGADTYSWYLADSNTVHVDAQVTFQTFFAGILGLNAMTASAESEASVGLVTQTDNLLPMTIEEQEFEVGELYTLWDNRRNIPGGFGWLDWNGVPVSATELASNICNPGNSGAWDVGDWIPSGPGVTNSGPVRQCLNTWIGREVTIPIYDLVAGRGANGRYRIVTFARFVLQDYRLTGNPKWVSGTFVQSVVPGAIGQQGGEEYELRAVDLTR